MKSWADAFGGELYSIVTKYSGSLLLQKVGDSCDDSSGLAASPNVAFQPNSLHRKSGVEEGKHAVL